MRLGLLRPIDQFVASGGQAVVLVVGFMLHEHFGPSLQIAITTLLVSAAIGLYGWTLALRRRRLIVDTPTARIATAAQGFVELLGVGRLFHGQPVIARLSRLPCLWYRFKVEQRGSDDKWRVIDQGESDASILVDDGTAEAAIDPLGAEVVTRHRDVWHAGDYRHTEWKLMQGDSIYVLGELNTIGGSTAVLDAGADTAQLLAEWKRDPAALKRRFDLDGNDEIDLTEWALARAAARREVARQHREARAAADAHLVRAPRDGRPFLIANIDPERLARRFGLWSLAHLTSFVGALAAIPWAIARMH